VRRGVVALVFAAVTIGCSVPASNGRVTETPVPDPVTFPFVGQVLEVRCGTLDCHGTIYRNLRIYGDEGLRYKATDRPCYPKATTPDEYTQDYDSVVGLQPEVMSQVMADQGADPERLDFLAKPMGLDAHKGLTVIKAGDDSYNCITSWLAGQTDTAACEKAMLITPASSICGAAPSALFPGGKP